MGPSRFLIGLRLGVALVRLPRMLFPPVSGIETGPCQVPHCREARQSVGPVGGRRNGAGHGFDFHRAEGRR